MDLLLKDCLVTATKPTSPSNVPRPHILVVDDDARLRALIQQYLTTQDNFLVSTCADVAQAEYALDLFQFQGLVLDIMMPGGPGTLLLERPNTPPVLLLTAMDTINDRIAGLEKGAKDYLIKPFDPRELSLRLKNILRQPRTALRLGDKIYVLSQRTLYTTRPDGQPHVPMALTTSEHALLRYFLQHLGQTLDRQRIAQDIFSDSSNVRTVDVQIGRLRKKIEPCPSQPRFLVSKRGQGYCLQGAEDVS